MQSKWLKLLLLMGAFLLLSSPIAAWDDLIEFNEGTYKGRLEYDHQEKLVRLKFKKRGNWGRSKIEGPFSVASSGEVDQTLGKLEGFFGRFVFPENVQGQILSRVHEFKFLGAGQCQALHFSLGELQNQEVISALVEEVEKIRLAQNPGSQAYRSLLIREFKIQKTSGEEEVIQLRMTLDKQGQFLKFSFAKDQGDLSDYSWTQSNGKVLLKDKSGHIVLELDMRSFIPSNDSSTDSGGLVIVRHAKREGLENIERSYFRLRFNSETRSAENSWEVYPYTTQHFQETVIRNGVALTSGTAEHTPVIQINGSEIAFARLNLEQVRDVFPFKEVTDNQLRKIESHFNQCMGERLSFIFEEERLGIRSAENFDRDQQIICQRKAELEGVALVLQNEVTSKSLNQETSDEVDISLRSCFQDKKLAAFEAELFSFDYQKLFQSTKEDFLTSKKDCFHQARGLILKAQIKKDIDRNRIIQEHMDGERTKNLLWQSVKAKLESNCLSVVAVENLDSCLDYGELLVEENLFLAQTSLHLSQLFPDDRNAYGEKRLQLIGDFSNCRRDNNVETITALRSGTLEGEQLSAIQNKDLDCARRATLKLATLSSRELFSQGLGRMGLDSNAIMKTEDDLQSVLGEFNNCLQEAMRDEAELSSLIGKISFYQESCLTVGLLPLVKKGLIQDFDTLVEGYDFLSGDRDKEILKERAIRLIERELAQWEDVSQYKALRDSLLEPLHSLILKDHFDRVEEVIGEEQSSALRAHLGNLLNDNTSRPLKLKLSRYLNQVLLNAERGERSKEEYLRVAMNDLVKQVHLFSFPLKTKREMASEVLLESDAEEMAARVDEHTNACWNDYSPNRRESVESTYRKCEKKRQAKVALELFRRRMERHVAKSFPLTSVEANKILTPIQYIESCFKGVDPYNNKTVTEYSKLIQGCLRVAELDLSYNISNAKIESYRPLLSRRGYHDAVTAYCYNIIFHHFRDGEVRIPRRGESSGPYRDLTKMQQSQRQRLPYEGSLLRFFESSSLFEPEFSENDQRQMRGLVETFAANDEFNQEWWNGKLAHCEKGTTDFINVSFREYIVESIPALSFSNSNDPNAKLMRDFLDFELVEGLLAFKKAFEERHGLNSLDLGQIVPGQRTLDPELGITALTNFIQVLGDYISKGFVFDEQGMRTELIVFQSELKSFLRWSKGNPERISINEAMDFFKESKLAEHLALAAIAETTYDKFVVGIGTMKRDELEKLYDDANCRFMSCLNREEKEKHRRIIAKYDELLKLCKEMISDHDFRTLLTRTNREENAARSDGLDLSAYDFRRIISPESVQGEEIIESIKQNILMPKILGGTVSAAAETQVLRLVGEALLRDNTDGGFAERFVEQAAQFALTEEENNRWGITKFFFFDKKDFDWETLKKTEAGERAINYYARFIMLPRFLGERQNDYLVNLRLQRFRELLTQAQKQNDD